MTMKSITIAGAAIAGLAFGLALGRGSARSAEARREEAKRPPPVETVAPYEAPAAPASTSGPPPVLRGIAEEIVLEEERRWRAYEAELVRIEGALADVESVAKAESWERVVDLVEQLLSEIPKVNLAILDSAALDRRARILRVRLCHLLSQAQLALLRASKPADEAEAAIHFEKELRLSNTVREGARRLEEIKLLPPLSTDVIRRRETREAPARDAGDDAPWRMEAKQKVASMRVTLDFAGAPASSVVEHLRVLSGLNIVLRGTLGTTPVTLKLTDVLMEAALTHLADAIGARWEVDRFGVVVIAAR